MSNQQGNRPPGQVECYTLVTKSPVTCVGCGKPIRVGTQCAVLVRWFREYVNQRTKEHLIDRYREVDVRITVMTEPDIHVVAGVKPIEWLLKNPPQIEYRHLRRCGVGDSLRQLPGSFESGRRRK